MKIPTFEEDRMQQLEWLCNEMLEQLQEFRKVTDDPKEVASLIQEAERILGIEGVFD